MNAFALPSSVRMARRIREYSLRATSQAGSSHIGSCLSVADILAVIYSDEARVAAIAAGDPDRDVVIVSKGHAAAAHYGALLGTAIIDEATANSYCKRGSALLGHVSHHVPGVEYSTGSLGHGLALGVGTALGKRIAGRKGLVLCILSDGECDEGSTWEAAMIAHQQRLSNLVVVVDNNHLQGFGRTAAILNLEPLEQLWDAHGWVTTRLDGHDHTALRGALAQVHRAPHAIIADTVKGKGVAYMEDSLSWHYRSVPPEDLEQAVSALEMPNA